MRTCSIQGCVSEIFTNYGFCAAHYSRWRRHGDPLAGRPSPGSAARYFETVVARYEGSDCLIWPFGRSSAGYGLIWKDGKMQVVSRLLCAAVHGPAEISHEAAHSCGNGHAGCVTKNHLSWKTVAGNAADRIVHGTHLRGSRQWMSKLTETQAREIISLKGKETLTALSKRFGVSFQHIGAIQSGKAWGWLADEEAAVAT